jgi:serine/threonine-protein phosphatase PP1 catalytic subunit
MIEGRLFHIGDECLLSSEEFKWLNEKLIERHCMPIDSVPRNYVIEGRSFYIGEEHLLSPEELEWLNEKLVKRHCLPVEYAKNRDEYEDLAFKETAATLRKLIPEVTGLLSSEPALVYKDSEPVIIVGELFGDVKSLDFILKEFEEVGNGSIVFLGGYLNEDIPSLDILVRLFQLKMKFPDRLILLQGRHELAKNSPMYLVEKDQQLLSLVRQTFEKMPVAAIVNGSIFCINSGVPGGLGTKNIKKGAQDKLTEHDPLRYIKLLPLELDRDSETFGRHVYEGFMTCHWLKVIVQSHSPVPAGYKWWYEGKLLSLVSAPARNETFTRGAFAVVKNGQMDIFSFGDLEEGKYHLTDVVKGPYWSLLYRM